MFKLLLLYIIDLFECFSGIKIPRLNQILSREEVETNSYILSYLGIFIIGIVGSVLIVGGIEYLYPHTFDNIPVLGNGFESIRNFYYSYFPNSIDGLDAEMFDIDHLNPSSSPVNGEEGRGLGSYK